MTTEVIKTGKRQFSQPSVPAATAMLGRGCAPGDAQHQEHHSIEEHGWPQWLQQLPRNLILLYYWESFHVHSPEQTSVTCLGCIHCSTMQIQCWKINNWRGLHLGPAEGEMLEAKTAAIHHTHWPDQGLWLDQGLWPGLQEKSLHSATEDWLFLKAPEDDHILPRRHAEPRPVWWIFLGLFPKQQ